MIAGHSTEHTCVVMPHTGYILAHVIDSMLANNLQLIILRQRGGLRYAHVRHVDLHRPQCW